MDWTDFASPSGGFVRTDRLLDASLSFAAPLQSSINDWPRERDELQRRLHKSQKDATPFSYDTTPRVGPDAIQDNGTKYDSQGRVYMEVAFVDCWADLILGCNWLDREELTFREANWAIVSGKCLMVWKLAQENTSQVGYQALPNPSPSQPVGDTRTSELYFIFEERIPPEYQLAVSEPRHRNTFTDLFSPKSKKRNTTVTPPRIGSGWQDLDFDRMLLHRQNTKKITVSRSAELSEAVWSSPSASTPVTPLSTPHQITGYDNRSPKSDEAKSKGNKINFFGKNKNRVVQRVLTDEEKRAWPWIQKEHEMDIRMRTASNVGSIADNLREDGRKAQSDTWMGEWNGRNCTRF